MIKRSAVYVRKRSPAKNTPRYLVSRKKKKNGNLKRRKYIERNTRPSVQTNDQE